MSTRTSKPSSPVLPDQNRMSFGRWFSAVGLRHVVGLLAVVFAAFPIVYVISASVSTRNTMTDANKLFATFTWDNYAMLGCNPDLAADVNKCAKVQYFYDWFLNSLAISSITALGTVLMGASAAYAFSRFRFTGRRVGLTSLLVIQMFPQMLAFVAILILMTALGEVAPILGTGSAWRWSRSTSAARSGPTPSSCTGSSTQSRSPWTRPRRSMAPPTRRPTGRSSCRW